MREHLSEQEFRRIAKAIADPTRYRVMQQIYKCFAVTPTQISSKVPISPATMFHHLRELEQAGLIESWREGRSRYLVGNFKVWHAFINALTSVESGD